MSRTRKGSKPPGYEFWSKRPAGQGGRGAYAKKITHKVERLDGKTDTRQEAERLSEKGTTT